MAKRPLPSPEVLRQLLCLNPNEGKVYWRERPDEMFERGQQSVRHNAATWNARWAGKQALTAKTSKGYFHGSINSKYYLRHRVIWALAHGKWPEALIDHANGDITDNRLSNLREATHSQNTSNRRPSNKTSKYMGVSWNTKRETWQAFINLNGRSKWLGYHPCEITAANAYDAAAKSARDEFRRLNFPR